MDFYIYYRVSNGGDLAMANHSEVTDACPKNGQPTIRNYIIGFIVSIILTYTAFAFVEQRIFTGQDLYIAIALLALAQLLVQAIFFLHLNAKDEESRWDLVVFVFTLLIVTILVSGSLWIMYNLNYNMVN